MSGDSTSFVLVTGAAAGIGHAATLRLADAGRRVLAIDRNEEDLAKLASVPGVQTHLLDLLHADNMAAFAHGLVKKEVRISGIVNNAAVQGGAPIEDQTQDDWQRFLDVNVTAPWLIIKHLLPLMVPDASIVNIGSVASVTGFANRAAYCASKHALAGLTKALAAELSPRGIRVNLLCLGTIETPALLEIAGERRDAFAARQLLGRMGTPDEAAAAIEFLLGPNSAFMTGSIMTVDGGLLAKSGA